METIYHPLCEEIQTQVLHHEITEHISADTLNNDIFVAEHHVNIECYPYFHTNAEMLLILSGDVEITIGGHSRYVTAGDCVFVIPYESHYYRTERGSESVLFRFHPSLIEHFDRLLGKTQIANPVFHPDGATVEYIKSRLPLIGENFTKLEAQALLYTLLCVLMKKDTESKQTVDLNYSLINQILVYIEKNFDKDLTLEMLAKEFGITAQGLSRMLRAHLRISYSDYLNNLRLTKSIPILKYTNKSVSEIAYECGFGSIRNYNRIFGEYMKKTPSEFRRDRETYYGF